MKAGEQWYRGSYSGHWKESQNGPRNTRPQKFSGWSSLLSEFARLVLTVVGPKRLATSQMVDDQQNVDPVCFPLIGCELHFSGIRSAVLPSLASPP